MYGLFVCLAVLVHFACLATFAWLNVLCFDLWWDIRYNCNSKIPFHDLNMFCFVSQNLNQLRRESADEGESAK